MIAVEPLKGTQKWAYTTMFDADIGMSTAIAWDGKVVVGDEFAVSLLDGGTGALLARYKVPAAVTTTPTIDADGTIYVGLHDGEVLAMDEATGQIKWSYASGRQVTTSIAIGTNRMVYFGSWDFFAAALGE